MVIHVCHMNEEMVGNIQRCQMLPNHCLINFAVHICLWRATGLSCAEYMRLWIILYIICTKIWRNTTVALVCDNVRKQWILGQDVVQLLCNVVTMSSLHWNTVLDYNVIPTLWQCCDRTTLFSSLIYNIAPQCHGLNIFNDHPISSNFLYQCCDNVVLSSDIQHCTTMSYQHCHNVVLSTNIQYCATMSYQCCDNVVLSTDI